MKKQWINPEIANLAVEATQNPTTLDLGHGLDPYNHDHKCTCGLNFDTWQESQDHVNEMSIQMPGQTEHNIRCNIIYIS